MFKLDDIPVRHVGNDRCAVWETGMLEIKAIVRTFVVAPQQDALQPQCAITAWSGAAVLLFDPCVIADRHSDGRDRAAKIFDGGTRRVTVDAER